MSTIIGVSQNGSSQKVAKILAKMILNVRLESLLKKQVIHKNLVLFRNLTPYEEIFIGSNYESYKNKYFVCSFETGNNNSNSNSNSDLIVLNSEVDNEQNLSKNKFDKYEISDVQWFSYSQA